MIRLFISIEIPPIIRTFLHSMGRSLHGARAVPEDQIHITMRFIGEVEGSVLHDIRDHLSSVDAEPFFIKISGVGHFPPRGNPRVVWAGIEKNDQLFRLKKKLDRALYQAELPPDNRKFSPHITIARLNNCSLQRVTTFLSGNAFLQFDEFEVKSFHLYSSKLSHKGAIHTCEESYSLTGNSLG